MQFHDDPLRREQTIVDYLLRRLDGTGIDAFESHYLECDECFEELKAAELLMRALSHTRIAKQRIGEVALIRFNTSADLTHESSALTELSHSVLDQGDRNVLIDLSRVSRIDSAGLGQLMRFYSHLAKQQGTLKVLKPSLKVSGLLKMTKIDSVLRAYEDEQEALSSFGAAGGDGTGSPDKDSAGRA